MGVDSWCGCKEVQYIDFLILLIPTPLVSVLFCSSIPTFCSFFKMFFILVTLLIKRNISHKNVMFLVHSNDIVSSIGTFLYAGSQWCGAGHYSTLQSTLQEYHHYCYCRQVHVRTTYAQHYHIYGG